MKKMYLVIMAVAISIGLSAFAPATGVKQTTVYYRHNNQWVSELLSPCPTGTDPVCEITTAAGTKQIYKSESFDDPFKKPEMQKR
jgi:Family of unknown function (DUF6520)